MVEMIRDATALSVFLAAIAAWCGFLTGSI